MHLDVRKQKRGNSTKIYTRVLSFFTYVYSRESASQCHACVFVVSLEAGRRAIKSNNGLQLLYRFCTNCPEDKAYDCLLSRICGIINQCLEKRELPVSEMSPAR